MIDFLTSILGLNLTCALLALPLVILGNVLLGAVIGGFEHRFSFKIFITGVFKGLVIYVSIILMATAATILGEFSIPLGTVEVGLIDGVFIIVIAAILKIGEDFLSKLSSLFRIKTEDLFDKEEEVDYIEYN